MAKSRQQKQSEVKTITGLFAEMKSGVVASFTHVKVKDERTLRESLKKVDAGYRIVKKNLLKLALQEMKLAHEFLEAVRGTIVLAVGRNDMIAPVKEVANFAKKNEKFSIQGGFLHEGDATRVLSAADVRTLATMPGREELIARVVGSVRSPLSGMVNVLAGNMRGLVQVLTAISQQKG